MIYNKILPTIDEGVGTLFDTTEVSKIMIINMLKHAKLDDKYLYIVGVDSQRFREYYISVSEKCHELNELIVQEGCINTAVVSPKAMFLFNNMESCYQFKNYFERITDPEELVRYTLAYQSTEYIVMTLDVLIPDVFIN